jgi:predicted O-methyltransferase YrrM
VGELIKTQPWLPSQFIEVFADWDTGRWMMWEFGSGLSTKWFAKRVKHLWSMEHDPSWHHSVKKACEELDNVTLMRCNLDSEYVTRISRHPDNFFDVVLVDGRKRVECFKAALPKTKGVIILDNGLRTRYREVFDIMGHDKDWLYYVSKWTDPVIRDGQIVPVKNSWHTCMWVKKGFSVK